MVQNYLKLAIPKLGGLISRIYGTYFPNELPPFAGMPTTVINQSQNQQQNITLLLDVQSKIDEKISSTKDPKEKNFLEKIKSSLPNVKNAVELVNLILSIGSNLGLNINQILKMFQ